MSRECPNPSDGVDRAGAFKKQREERENAQASSNNDNTTSSSSNTGWPGASESDQGKDVWASVGSTSGGGGW